MLQDSILIFPERYEKGGGGFQMLNFKKLNHKESEVIMDHVLYSVFMMHDNFLKRCYFIVTNCLKITSYFNFFYLLLSYTQISFSFNRALTILHLSLILDSYTYFKRITSNHKRLV